MTPSSRGGEDAGVADEVEVGGRNLPGEAANDHNVLPLSRERLAQPSDMPHSRRASV
jgi:hypothetical protein